MLRSLLEQTLPYDLRTPLGTILSGARTLVDDAQTLDPTRLREVASGMQQSALRMQHMLEQFLFLMELQLVASDPSRLALAQAARCTVSAELLATVSQRVALAHHRRAAVRCAISEAPVQMSLEHLCRIVHELVDNALRFSPPTTCVDVQLTHGPAAMQLCVTNKGRGLTQEEIAGMQGLPVYGQRGLGLLIVRHLVATYGGTIHIESAPFADTCVEVVLPNG